MGCLMWPQRMGLGLKIANICCTARRPGLLAESAYVIDDDMCSARSHHRLGALASEAAVVAPQVGLPPTYYVATANARDSHATFYAAPLAVGKLGVKLLFFVCREHLSTCWSCNRAMTGSATLMTGSGSRRESHTMSRYTLGTGARRLNNSLPLSFLVGTVSKRVICDRTHLLRSKSRCRPSW